MGVMGIVLPTIAPAVWASLAAALVATLGLAVVSVSGGWADRNRNYFAGFAAGVLVTSALLLLPEAIERTPSAPYFALLGYLFLFSLNALLRQSQGAVAAPLIAVSFHSFIDGFEYGVLFDHDVVLGTIASLGLITHEFAEAVILFSLLKVAGISTRTAFIATFIGAALTTPMGALLSQPLLNAISPNAFAQLLAIAAGALLYVGATHLPGHLVEGVRWRLLLSYLLGIGLAVVLAIFVHPDHSHHSDPDHDHQGEGVDEDHHHPMAP